MLPPATKLKNLSLMSAPDPASQPVVNFAALRHRCYALWLPLAAWFSRWLPAPWSLRLALWLGPEVCADICRHLRIEEVAALGEQLPTEFVADITAYLPRPLARQLLIYLPAPKLREVMGVLLGRGARRLAAVVADAITARLAQARNPAQQENHRR